MEMYRSASIFLRYFLHYTPNFPIDQYIELIEYRPETVFFDKNIMVFRGKNLVNGQDVREILGKGIRFYRQQKQLSQAALAEKANISVTFLSNIERGVKYPTSDTLSAIANSLDLEVFELFRHDFSPIKNRDLFERFKKDLRRNVITILDTVYREYE